jgi:hypothetical protein
VEERVGTFADPISARECTQTSPQAPCQVAGRFGQSAGELGNLDKLVMIRANYRGRHGQILAPLCQLALVPEVQIIRQPFLFDVVWTIARNASLGLGQDEAFGSNPWIFMAGANALAAPVR